ncbi:hypothetical protein ACHAWF_000864 [Thalassiosira exigua]
MTRIRPSIRRLAVLLALALASLCLCFPLAVADDGIDCRLEAADAEEFATGCGGEGGGAEDAAADFDASELVDEVLADSKESRPAKKKEEEDGRPRSGFDSQEGARCDASSGGPSGGAAGGESGALVRQLRQTSEQLLRRYYDPLPKQGKCAVGTACGLVSSRIALGAANRLVRLAGATWALSEALHASGFCDEARCLPEEARPFLGVLRNALVRQCARVRTLARRMWDRDRLREAARKDEAAVGGFLAGAFVGFVI